MDNWQTQDAFWNSFGVPAFDENTLLEDGDVTFPYITYEARDGSIDQVFYPNASLWDRGSSWERVSKLANRIKEVVSNGRIIKTDGGFFWFKMPQSTTFAQRISGDAEDESIRRIVLTIEAESLSK